MEQAVWLAFGAFAFLTTFGALALQSLPRVVNQLGVVFAMLLWLYWAIAAGDVTVTTNCCVQHYEYYGAQFLGLGAGLICAILLIDSVWGVLGLSEPRAEEVSP